jgi:chitinase
LSIVIEFGGSSPDYGDKVIGAAKSVIKQMKSVWPEKTDGEIKRMLGVYAF